MVIMVAHYFVLYYYSSSFHGPLLQPIAGTIFHFHSWTTIPVRSVDCFISIHGPLSQFTLWTIFQFLLWIIIPVHSHGSVDAGLSPWACAPLVRVRLMRSELSDPFKCQGKRRAGCPDLVSIELLQCIPCVRCFMQLSNINTAPQIRVLKISRQV